MGQSRAITLLVFSGLATATLVMLYVGAHWLVFLAVWVVGTLAALTVHGATAGRTLPQRAADLTRDGARGAGAAISLAAYTLLAVVIVSPVIGWAVFYMFTLRPLYNAMIFQYVSRYPAMLHACPIVGIPAAIGWVVVTVFEVPRDAKARATLRATFLRVAAWVLGAFLLVTTVIVALGRRAA